MSATSYRIALTSRSHGETSPGGVSYGEPSRSGSVDMKRDLDLNVEPNMYAAVLVASFGGVFISLSNSRHAKVHPFLLMICCIPLFIAQASSVFALRLQLHLGDFYEGKAEENALLRLKVLMIAILNLINFNTLLDSVSNLLFCFNPITWIEIEQPSKSEWVGPVTYFAKPMSIIFSKAFLVPWPFLALAMDFAVSYIVATDSTSLILDSSTVQDVMFNSLAITFIIELGRYYWRFVKVIFHLSALEHFRFRSLPMHQIWTKTGQLRDDALAKLMFPRVVDQLARWTRCSCFGARRSFLSRNAGARRLEHVLSLLGIYFIFKRQFSILLYAIDTNVVPAARDICMMWRVQLAAGWRDYLAKSFDIFVIFDARSTLKYFVASKLNGCQDPNLARMSFSDEIKIQYKYLLGSIMFSVCVGSLLILPQLAHSFHHFLLPHIDAAYSDEEETVGIKVTVDENERKRSHSDSGQSPEESFV